MGKESVPESFLSVQLRDTKSLVIFATFRDRIMYNTISFGRQSRPLMDR